MEKKIMIVDDAMFMRKLIRRNLEAEGYRDIIEASDGNLHWSCSGRKNRI